MIFYNQDIEIKSEEELRDDTGFTFFNEVEYKPTFETNIEAMGFHQFLDFANDIFIRNMIIQHPTKTKWVNKRINFI